MSNPASGRSIVIAALILGASIVGASLLLKMSLDRLSSQLETAATARLAVPAPTPGAAPSGRPDPNQRYSIDIAGAPRKGNAKASITLIEFSDFQCPFCARVGPTLDQIEKTYGERVQVVFKHLPLRIHPKAPAAHAAAEAAHRQGKFWEMHDLIFANQREMSPESYEKYAQQLGLDVERFRKDVGSTEVRARVQRDSDAAAGLGVTGTPAFFINGRFLSGAQPFESFKRLIDEELSARG